MRVLVTGAGGFSGGHMVSGLKRLGHDVISQFRNSPNKADNDEVLECDLSSPFILPEGLDAIVHCAARSGLRNTSAADLVKDNQLATENLVKHGIQQSVGKFIYFSSLSVYGDIREDRVTETTPRHNPNDYGQTKYAGEKALEEASSKMPSVSFRLPGILGKGAVRHWLAGVTSNLLTGQDVTLFNPDQPFNNAVHIEDLCLFTNQILSGDLNETTALVLGAKDPLSIRQVVMQLKENLNSVSKIIEEEAGDRRSFLLSSQRAIDRFGYQPKSMSDLLVRYARDLKT